MVERRKILIRSYTRTFVSGLFLVVLFFAIGACKKEETPENPFDAVDYNTGSTDDSIPNPASITGLHTNIFYPKCANPGCHDGTFEPDFRTVQSTYSTLVFMGVNKTTLDSVRFFNYRVLPGDVNNSFLMERLLTTTSDYMPSNGVRLPSSDIDNITKWLRDSCPDINGNLPQKPNLPPNIIGFIAADQQFNRIDTIRAGGIPFNPFIAPANSIFYLPIVALDTADGITATDPVNFTLNQVRFSTDRNNFSGALTMNATWFSPIPFAVWQCTVNTAVWTAGTTVYFRIYVNDGFQVNPAEFPKNNSLDYFKTYYSFIIQ